MWELAFLGTPKPVDEPAQHAPLPPTEEVEFYLLKLLQEALVALRRAMEERGRDPQSLHIVPMGVMPDRAKLDHYASLGVTETVLRVPSESRERVLPVLDAYQQYL